MTEIVRFSPLGKQDLRIGTGQFEVELADGRVIILDELDIAHVIGQVLLPSFTLAGLPPAGTAGLLARVTDSIRGPAMYNGTGWGFLYPVTNLEHFPGASADIRIQAAIDALPAAGGVVDARGLTGAQTISATISITGKRISVLLGNTILTSTAVGSAFNISGAAASGSQIIGIKEATQITSAVNAPIMILDSVTGLVVSDLLLNSTGTGTNVRGISMRNTTADNKWNTLQNLRVVSTAAGAPVAGQAGIEYTATTANALYWNTMFDVQFTSWDRGIKLVGSGGALNVVSGNFFDDILLAASTVGIELLQANNNHFGKVFHTLSGGPAATTGIKFGDGTSNAIRNIVTNLISDAGASAVPYDVLAGSNRNIIVAAWEGGTPLDAGTATLHMRVQPSATEVIASSFIVGPNPASFGSIRLPNAADIIARNVLNTGDVVVITLNASDQVEIARGGGDIRWGRATIALGGGAAPTFGTIGGAGPATAAQFGWERRISSDGVASWVPIWR